MFNIYAGIGHIPNIMSRTTLICTIVHVYTTFLRLWRLISIYMYMSRWRNVQLRIIAQNSSSAVQSTAMPSQFLKGISEITFIHVHVHVHVYTMSSFECMLAKTITTKGTKVQTLGALYACTPLIDGLGHATRSATYMYLSAHRLARLRDREWV